VFSCDLCFLSSTVRASAGGEVPLISFKGRDTESVSPPLLDEPPTDKEGKRRDTPVEDQKAVAPDEEEQSASVFDSDAQPVQSIGAILNGLDKAHYETQLTILFEVAERYDFNLGPIYAIGASSHKDDLGRYFPLILRGAKIEYPTEPPEEYDVSMSPTWLINTKKGQYVLEATGTLDRYFNSRGHFIEKPVSALPEREEPLLDTGQDLFGNE